MYYVAEEDEPIFLSAQVPNDQFVRASLWTFESTHVFLLGLSVQQRV